MEREEGGRRRRGGEEEEKRRRKGGEKEEKRRRGVKMGVVPFLRLVFWFVRGCFGNKLSRERGRKKKNRNEKKRKEMKNKNRREVYKKHTDLLSLGCLYIECDPL